MFEKHFKDGACAVYAFNTQEDMDEFLRLNQTTASTKEFHFMGSDVASWLAATLDESLDTENPIVCLDLTGTGTDTGTGTPPVQTID